MVEVSAAVITKPAGKSEAATTLFRGRNYGMGGRRLPPRTGPADTTQSSRSVWHHERQESYSRMRKQKLQSQHREGPAGQRSYWCQERGQVGTMADWRDEPPPAPNSSVTFFKKVFLDPGWIRALTPLGSLLAPSPSSLKGLLLL